MKIILKTKKLLIPILLSVLMLFPAVSVLAGGSPYGSGEYGECNYGQEGSDCSISISNNSFVLNLSITPAVAGSCTIQSDQVSVTTLDPNGYSLSLGNQSTTTGLVNGSNSVPASSGTPSSPSALSDTWGYRVDGWSSFGAGPTNPATNAAPNNSIKFAGAKASNLTADAIASTSSFNSGAVSTTVWYGICLDFGLGIPAGIYSSTVLYTATAS